jgi:hypothetical protein
MYPGPSCLDHPFSFELDDTEGNTRIRRVLAHGADLIFGSSPVPLREVVNSPWVSLLELTFIYLCHFLFFQCICVLMQDLGYARSTPQEVTLPKDAMRRGANRTNNERQQAQRQMRWARSVAQVAARAQGEETPSEPKSSGDGYEEEDEDEEGGG